MLESWGKTTGQNLESTVTTAVTSKTNHGGIDSIQNDHRWNDNDCRNKRRSHEHGPLEIKSIWYMTRANCQ